MSTASKEKWVAISVYYENIELILSQVIAPLAEKILAEKKASKFIFNRSWERGKNLLLMFKTTQYDYETTIKPTLSVTISKYFEFNPSPEREIELPVNDWFLPFPSNHISYNENFLIDIMETGGLQSSLIAEEILSESSSLILEFIKEAGEEWSAEAAIGPAIQIHLALISGFGMNVQEASAFYNKCFNNMLKMTQGGDDAEDFQATLIAGLEETFQMQKESLVGFSDYLISTFAEGEQVDDEWLNSWVSFNKDANNRLLLIQANAQYVAPEGFEADETVGIDALAQEKWPVLEYYLRAINCQMGITEIFELNLIYSIKESLNAILEQQEA
jgi:hypothetical protein